jgi:hypothetical protein
MTTQKDQEKNYILKLKCVVCGEVEVDFTYPFTDGDGNGFIVPVSLYQTLKDVDKLYEEITGLNYFAQCDKEIKDSFEQTTLSLSHLSPDDDGWEETEKHKLEPILCWREDI